MIRAELAQSRETGGDASVLDELAKEFNALPEDASQDDLHVMYQRVENVEIAADLTAKEPSDIAEIKALRPDGPRQMSVDLTEEQLADKVLGAWIGRAAGCMLGKPVEGWTRADIRTLLDATGEWPLSQWFPQLPDDFAGKRYHESHTGCLRGSIDRMVRDDDTDYTIMGLLTMEQYGPDFTPGDVAQQFQMLLPYQKVYTAERYAYRNLILGFDPPESARVANPAREWIGAQIRADFFGYVAPGNPELAADFAWRDAVVTHTRNGIYGEMWMAATIAAAFVADSAEEAIRIGMTEIPAGCRLTAALNDVISWVKEDGDPETTYDRIIAKYGFYHPVHTINNALLVAAGILYGEGDVGKTICIAVAGGWDTDCTGASAGSVVGAMVGARPIAYEWSGILNDTIESALSGFAESRISDLAARTMTQIERVKG
jgi:ADP-ribosylglycohydrolase